MQIESYTRIYNHIIIIIIIITAQSITTTFKLAGYNHLLILDYPDCFSCAGCLLFGDKHPVKMFIISN